METDRTTGGERSQQSRQRLIAAARQCLLERGHQACSIKAIAARAGVNHGLVHHYFGSKERLWMEVIRQEAESVRTGMRQEPSQFLDRFIIPEILRRPERIRLVIEFLALAKEVPGISAVLCEMFRLRRGEIQRLLGIDDAAMATLVFGALFGMALHRQLDPALPVEPAARRLLAWVAGDDAAPGGPEEKGAR